MKKAIIIANGKPPKKNVISFLLRNGYSTIICADGGANAAMKLGITPDFIIGDLDSIKYPVREFFKDKSAIIEIQRQNDTDVEKCLKFAISKRTEEVILLAATGKRLDHTLCNLGIVIKFFKKIKLKIIGENSLLIPYTGSFELSTIPGETISLYGFDRNTKIISNGLKYPLKNEALPFGERESTSNIAVDDKVKLKVTGGIIFIIRDFKTVKKHNLF